MTHRIANAFLAVASIACCALVAHPASAHRPWASDSPDQSQWIVGDWGTYDWSHKGIQAPGETNLPDWVSVALYKAGVRTSEPNTYGTTIFQVFAPNKNTRIIAAIVYGTDGCELAGGPETSSEVQKCPVQIVTVHANGSVSHAKTAPSCFNAVNDDPYTNHSNQGAVTFFRRDPSTGQIQIRVQTFDHHPVPRCNTRIMP